MKGLLLKDYLVMKKSWKSYALIALIYEGVAMAGNAAFVVMPGTIFLLIMPLSSFTADEMARWDKFAAAFPGGRRAMVDAKYLYLLTLALGCAALTALLAVPAVLLRRVGPSYGLLLLEGLSGIGVGLALNAVMLPLLFRFGTQKARWTLALAAGVIAGGGAILAVRGILGVLSPLEDLLDGYPALMAAAAALLVCAFVAASYAVSRRVCRRKEF